MRDAAFHAYFERHHDSLSRLAYLMIGDASAADDLAADAMTEVWRHWDRVQAADDPAAYGHGILMNLARNWIRKRSRERLFSLEIRKRAPEPDVPAVLDVRRALARLPHRRRACVGRGRRHRGRRVRPVGTSRWNGIRPAWSATPV